MHVHCPHCQNAIEIVEDEPLTEVSCPACGSSFSLIGDLTGDELINVSDVIFLVNYLYKEGPAPSPLSLGDVNCDDEINVGDLVYLVSYLYQGGTQPCSR